MKSELKKLHDKCWILWSKKIREEENYICFTCGKQCDKYTSQAGHFRHGKLDFDRMNIHCQCVGCNKYLHGRLGDYAMHLIKNYGQSAVDDLILRAEAHKGYKLKDLDKILQDLK